MGKLIRKSHNVSLLVDHFVFVAKYRRLVITEEVDQRLESTCMEIGSEGDHVHFLIQSIPMYSPSVIAKKTKSLIVREIFSKIPSVKKQLWGGEFWSDGYFVSTVAEHANEEVIREDIKKQGREGKYKQRHKEKPMENQLRWF